MVVISADYSDESLSKDLARIDILLCIYTIVNERKADLFSGTNSRSGPARSPVSLGIESAHSESGENKRSHPLLSA